jgi:hypothetical protein
MISTHSSGRRAALRHSLSAAILLATLATVAQAQDLRPPYAKEGAYVGFGGLIDFNLDARKFDGLHIYQEEGGEEFAILPLLQGRNLPKFIVGFRTGKGALEFSWERGRHDATFFDFPVGAVFNSVNIDGRFFFRTHHFVQPHVLIGLAFPWLTVDDGSFENDTPEAEVGDSRWRGPALNTEGGVTVYVTPRAGVSVGYSWRLIFFNRNRGVSGKVFEMKPPFKETSGNVVITGFFTF